jgi:hypothetical protein
MCKHLIDTGKSSACHERRNIIGEEKSAVTNHRNHLKHPPDVGHIVDMVVHVQIIPPWLRERKKQETKEIHYQLSFFDFPPSAFPSVKSLSTRHRSPRHTE